MASAIVLVSLLVLVALGVFLAIKLDSWRPRTPRFLRGAKHCPSCGNFWSTVVESDNRLNGMRECRACHYTWDPAAH
ncbi:hypothetical protein [Streptomyces sp. NBRC 109706]|uniref:hypothetical protein n=1 Tax=Streptomyces sp. NBRC 109706 TaxID=1550035 RepID=UPI0007829585|nr:hypothetical protein [Streptomyces sp. NBRC 109706]